MYKTAIFAALLLGCSEYDLTDKTDPNGGTFVTTPSTGVATGTGTATGGNGTGTGGTGTGGTGTGTGGTDNTGTGGWPPGDFGDEACSSGIYATWLSGEISVLSWDTGPAVGQLDSPVAGDYHVYDLSIAESGASQWNESAYIRIPNASNPSGLPNLGNCTGDYVVTDPDNYAPVPAGTTRYLGTFLLDRGINDLEMWHYCPVYRAGDCGSFHITDDASSTCDSGSVNSVHFTGLAVCLVPA